MINLRTKRVLLAAAVALGLPAVVSAQSTTPELTPAQQEIQALFGELQAVSQQLAPIQAEARKDPQITADEAELTEDLRVAMETMDPNLNESMAQVSALEAQAVTAHQDGDDARLQELIAEMRGLQTRYLEVQQSALAEPALAAKVQAYEALLERRMIEVDPAAEALLGRFRELEGRINAVTGSGG